MILSPLLAILLMPAASGATHAPQAGCARPYVVVVKKDGSVVEGRLLKDMDQGVLVQTPGRSVLVPEAEIDEVVEDCSHALSTPAAPARMPMAARAAPEPSARNSFIDFSQLGMRSVGGIMVGLGGTLLTSGIVMALLTFINALGSGIQNALLIGGLVFGVLGGLAMVLVGLGAGLLVGASFSNYLRETPPGARLPEEDFDPAM